MSSIELPEGFSWAQDIELGSPEVYQLSQDSWPRFLLEESDIPDPVLKFQLTADAFQQRFKVYGIRENTSKNLIAFMQAVHVEIDLAQFELPDLGWRFSIQNASVNSRKNCLSLVETSIAAPFRGMGLSKFLISRAKEDAKAQNFRHLIAPVRPTMKVEFADESIESYCQRKRADGRIFDSWLRTHVEAGAHITNICHNSVCVTASLQKWQEWTGLAFLKSGAQNIPGALVPLKVDIEAKVATYIEPNIWVRYGLNA